MGSIYWQGLGDRRLFLMRRSFERISECNMSNNDAKPADHVSKVMMSASSD